MRFIPGWSVPASWPALCSFALFMGVFSLLKGWFTLLVLPMLPCAAAVLLVTRKMHRQLLVRGGVHPIVPIFARIQLFGLAAFYFFLPALTDGPSLVFGFVPVGGMDPAIEYSMMICLAGLLGFVAGTVVIIVSYCRDESFPNLRALRRWATEFDRGG